MAGRGGEYCGHQADRFAAAIAAVQAILGDHQDTVVGKAENPRRWL